MPRKGTNSILILLLLIILVAIAISVIYYQSQQQPQAQGADFQKKGLPRIYPDPKLTPGDVLTTDGNIVCVSGYSSSVRAVSVSMKARVYEEYGLSYPQSRGAFEADHFIPLELGGSNDIKNLWPEAGEPRPGYKEKDEVENYLHREVCEGRMTLEEAQKRIREDWYSV